MSYVSASYHLYQDPAARVDVRKSEPLEIALDFGGIGNSDVALYLTHEQAMDLQVKLLAYLESAGATAPESQYVLPVPAIPEAEPQPETESAAADFAAQVYHSPDDDEPF